MAASSKLLAKTCYDLGHTWTPSCTYSFVGIFRSVFKESFKIYATLYVASSVLSGKNWDYYKKRLIPEILQSTLFLSVNGSCFVGFFCLLRQLLGKFYYFSSGFGPSFLASFLAILIERNSRRSVLALYMSTLAVEAAFNVLRSRGLVKTVPHGEVMMFCIGTAFAMLMYHSEDGMEQGPLKKIISFLLEPKVLSDIPNSAVNVKPSIIRLTKQTVRASLIGYAIGAISKLVMSLKYIKTNPGKIVSTLKHRDNINLGMFLGSFVALYKITTSLLHKLSFCSSDKWKSFLAGGVSGLSMIFYPSSSISLYLLSKLVELYYKCGMKQGICPTIPHADVLVYTLSTGLVLHWAALEPHNIRLSYWKFLNQITHKRFCEFNRKLFQQAYGGDSTRWFPDGDMYMSLRL